MKYVPSNLSNLTDKAVKLDADELVPAPVDFGKLSDTVRKMLLKRMAISY